MALLELVTTRPDWTEALSRALQRPAGVPERRKAPADADADGEGSNGHRRAADDLAWLRQAIEEPEGHGLEMIEGTAAVAIWEADVDDQAARLRDLDDRGVLEAAGFLLHPTP
jgi:hypothetical protein